MHDHENSISVWYIYLGENAEQDPAGSCLKDTNKILHVLNPVQDPYVMVLDKILKHVGSCKIMYKPLQE